MGLPGGCGSPIGSGGWGWSDGRVGRLAGLAADGHRVQAEGQRGGGAQGDEQDDGGVGLAVRGRLRGSGDRVGRLVVVPALLRQRPLGVLLRGELAVEARSPARNCWTASSRLTGWAVEARSPARNCWTAWS